MISLLALTTSFAWAMNLGPAGPPADQTANAANAAAVAHCQVALANPIVLPHALVAFDRETLARETVERARALMVEQPGTRGVGSAFEIVERAVSPTLENVAAFLRTRNNYPTIFDSNEVADQTTVVHGELTTRLERLKAFGGEVQERKPWEFWKPKATADISFAIKRIRILHYNLREMSNRMRESTAVVQEVLVTAHALNEALVRVYDVLDYINHDLTEDEFNRRVNVLRQDIGVQAELTRNLIQFLDQRIKFDAITQDRVRTLLNVMLPMVAMMGSSELDLSPLAPEDGGELIVAEDQTADPAARISVDAIIRLADKTSDYEEGNALIEGYVKKYSTQLSVTDALRLGAETSTWENNDRLLLAFVNTNLERLKVSEIKKIFNGIHDWDTADEVLLIFARRYARTLAGEQLVDLAEQSNYDVTKRKIMSLINI